MAGRGLRASPANAAARDGEVQACEPCIPKSRGDRRAAAHANGFACRRRVPGATREVSQQSQWTVEEAAGGRVDSRLYVPLPEAQLREFARQRRRRFISRPAASRALRREAHTALRAL